MSQRKNPFTQAAKTSLQKQEAKKQKSLSSHATVRVMGTIRGEDQSEGTPITKQKGERPEAERLATEQKAKSQKLSDERKAKTSDLLVPPLKQRHMEKAAALPSKEPTRSRISDSADAESEEVKNKSKHKRKNAALPDELEEDAVNLKIDEILLEDFPESESPSHRKSSTSNKS